MKISNFITTNTIIVDTKEDDKWAVLQSMIAQLVAVGSAKDADKALEAVEARENLMSTGVGNGLAIPHAQVEGIDKICFAIATSSDGIDFDALDGQPVNVVFMILTPQGDVSSHIEALAEISRIYRIDDVKDRLIDATTPQEIIDLIASL